MKEPQIYPRFVLPVLEAALSDTPVVVIHGPRQCGKSTLAQKVASVHGHQYLTFDDDNLLLAAQEDPVGFCAELPDKVVLDEIQRVPELFTTIKMLIDRHRRPGGIILTGSANIMLLPKLADSLAGRMEIIRLSPLAQIEIENSAPGPGFLDQLFSGKFTATPCVRLGSELIERVLKGGFPPVLTRASWRRRRAWQKQYAKALTLRDIRDLAKIRSMEAIPRLLEVVAGQTATLFNISKLASSFELSRPTIHEYLILLQHVFLVDLLSPWASNRLKRQVKTPKIHLADSGLAGALLGVGVTALKENRALYGQLLESFVCQELRRQATWADRGLRFYHYRDKDQVEVDVVIEQEGNAVCGVEVKAASTVRKTDFTGLKRLRASHDHFICGVVLYDGAKTIPFGDRLYAVPFSELWRLQT